MTKKGAIELSMTTIIVVVIGITLLSLGLMWVNNLFNQLGTSTDDAFRVSSEAMSDAMSPDDKFFVAGSTLKVKSGDISYIGSGLQFFADDPTDAKTFTISVTSHQDWFETLPFSIELQAGDSEPIPIGVKIPSNIEKGTIETVTIQAKESDGTTYGQEVIIVEVI